MIIVHVHVRLKPGLAAAFQAASSANAAASRREPGVARFDVLQQTDDPNRFLLIEVYRSGEDQARHKETAHYQVWRDAVAPMMVEPRISVKYTPVSTAD